MGMKQDEKKRDNVLDDEAHVVPKLAARMIFVFFFFCFVR